MVSFKSLITTTVISAGLFIPFPSIIYLACLPTVCLNRNVTTHRDEEIERKRANETCFYPTAATLTYAQDSSSPVQGYTNKGSKFAANWNIPASGQDVYVQIQGPTSAGWAGTGIGSGMKGALIFIIYQDGSGNVTVSPRLGKWVFCTYLYNSSWGRRGFRC